MWLWMVLCVVCVIVYSVGYVLLRTSGDGRRWRQRLVHPSKGALQEEYGGAGRRIDGDGSKRRASGGPPRGAG